MTIDILKIIGCAAMVFDHVGKVFFPNNLIFQIIGRLAYPLSPIPYSLLLW
ncbi:MAG: TraX family protein [Clostridiales bacterium]